MYKTWSIKTRRHQARRAAARALREKAKQQEESRMTTLLARDGLWLHVRPHSPSSMTIPSFVVEDQISGFAVQAARRLLRGTENELGERYADIQRRAEWAYALTQSKAMMSRKEGADDAT